MCSAYKAVAILALAFAGTSALASMPPLRVCADAGNLPFSNTQQQGFENALAHMVAHDLHRDMQFLWLPQQAEQVEKAMRVLNCDLVMGTSAPSREMVLSAPYYRSSFVFVSRRDRNIDISSLADARLANYRIGAHVIGGADATVPPAQELARRGLVRNIVGYSIYGHPTQANPSSELISAVAHGDVDLAVAWGPMAGYFAKTSAVPLRITPICNPDPAMPVAFSISMGIRRGDDLMREQVNRILARREKQIRGLLASYGVPLLDLSDTGAACR
ncbi:MAG: quinoprotein dehydrogenase-associated putative ABC transporter substrate-binding protein [Terriglobales bacterium]